MHIFHAFSRLFLISFICVLSIIPSVFAEETESSSSLADKELSYTLQPEGCEFSVKLPSEPYFTKTCSPEGKCYKLANYTDVINMTQTLNFKIICNPQSPEMLSQYNKDVLESLLTAHAEKQLEQYQTHYAEIKGIKVSDLTGVGVSGRSQMVYVSQIWVGKTSLFMIEGELIGDGNDDVDKYFAKIISSITHPALNPEPSNDEDKEQDKSDDKETEADEE